MIIVSMLLVMLFDKALYNIIIFYSTTIVLIFLMASPSTYISIYKGLDGDTPRTKKKYHRGFLRALNSPPMGMYITISRWVPSSNKSGRPPEVEFYGALKRKYAFRALKFFGLFCTFQRILAKLRRKLLSIEKFFDIHVMW